MSVGGQARRNARRDNTGNHVHHWLTHLVQLPRWFFITMTFGAGLFTLAIGYIAGHTAGQR